jgi:anti-anti-sigma factor
VDVQHLRIRAQISEIGMVSEFVTTSARRVGLDDEQVHHCQLAVDEVCTNIIEHGYGVDHPDGVIDVLVQTHPERFIIKIYDDSRPFDPLKRPNPDPNASIDERSSGGWGIFFVKKLIDEVSYDYKDGRNQLTLVKYLNRVSKRDIRVTEHPGDVWLIAPRGSLDEESSPKLGKVLAQQLDAGHIRLILDMGSVSQFSSTALREIMSAYKRARALRGDLVLACVRPDVIEYFRTVGLDLVFTLFETLEEAFALYQSRR